MLATDWVALPNTVENAYYHSNGSAELNYYMLFSDMSHDQKVVCLMSVDSAVCAKLHSSVP